MEIIWYDSAFEHGWHYTARKALPTIKTIGYVAGIDKHSIEIASTVGVLKGGILNPLMIPMGAIERVKVVKL